MKKLILMIMTVAFLVLPISVIAEDVEFGGTEEEIIKDDKGEQGLLPCGCPDNQMQMKSIIEGSTIVNIVANRNLFNPAEYIENATLTRVTLITINNGIRQTNDDYNILYKYSHTHYILEENTNYTIQFTINNVSAHKSYFKLNRTSDNLPIFERYMNGSYTITFNTGTNTGYYITMLTQDQSINNTGYVDFTNIQLEKGNTATTYVPYDEFNVTNLLTSFDDISTDKIVGYIVLGLAITLSLILMWFGIRKLIYIITSAYRNGKLRV